MYLSSLKLTNFRLHKNTSIQFSNGLNYIIGGNGQGKTTILEAIYYISTTKSFTSNSDAEVVNFNEDYFEIYGNIFDLTQNTMIVRYSKSENRKFYSLNGKLISSPKEIVGRFPVVFLSPSDSKITEEAPQERRKFVDSVISQLSKTYFENLLEYKKILKQRSSLLLKIRESFSTELFNELDVWNARLIEVGSKLIIARKKFVFEFNDYVKDIYAKILNGNEEPSIEYQTINHNSDDEIQNVLYSELERQRENELRRAANLVGPHKDDFKFSINGISLRDFGSLGQHKTFQVALRFAEYFYLKNKLGKSPFFLLDDVFGHLDRERSQKISEHLSELGQAFITLTDLNDMKNLQKTDMDCVIQIQNGSVVNVN
ncbi:MAG: DNA replication/repair protein RecF [Ignavibacteria bacterium]|jgi:DNA replication and repair protein RecF|nr:DNA replication/repair protein RecF [Ignavibacteria bacterium]MDH7527796.1 DNA replication/repair protein RecF [Ignavibacteria bacterium]